MSRERAPLAFAGRRRILASALLAASLAAAAAHAADRAPLSWKKLDTLGASGLTFESACSYDEGVGLLVMFGGHGWAYSGVERNDTWLFDPATSIWRAADPANRPVGACNTRDLVYDAARGVSVYYGGCMYYHGWQLRAEKIRGGAPPWVYDAARDTWIAMKPTGDTPPRTAYTGMAYDSHDQVVVKFGGGGCNAFDDGKTWIYDGHANTWTRRSPARHPGSGRLPSMTYDEKHRLVLLFGAGDGMSNELWAYDIRKDEWRVLEAADPPPAGQMVDINWGGPVDYGLFVYDRRLEMPILFRPRHGVLGAWAYDFEAKAWKRLYTRNSPPGAGLIQGAYVRADNATILVNGGTPGHTDSFLDGTWSFAHPLARARETLPAPAGVRLALKRDSAELAWLPVESEGVEGYSIYRGTGERPWEVPYEKIGESAKPRFEDTSVPAAGTVYYYVTARGGGGVEGAESMKVRTQPAAPAEPWVSAPAGGGIEIAWEKSASPGVEGYNVYRGKGRPGTVGEVPVDGEAGAFVRVNDRLVRAARFEDHVPFSESLAYLIRAVNARGEESGPSPWSLAIPAEVQGVRAGRNEAGGIIVRWRPNRERSLAGYNVYRMDAVDQRDIEPLNDRPVLGTSFVDATKTDERACRYYVAAVDERGIEGLMSYGAWAFDDLQH